MRILKVCVAIVAVALFTGATCTWQMPPDWNCVPVEGGGFECIWEIDELP